MNLDNLPVCLLPVVRSGLDPGVHPDQSSLPEHQPFLSFRDPKDKVRDRPPLNPAAPGRKKLTPRITGERNYGPVTPNFALKPADVESGFFLALFSDDRVK